MENATRSTPYRDWPEYDDPNSTDPDVVDLDRVFLDDLQRNPEVCSNCWTHIRDEIRPHYDSKRGDHTVTAKSIVAWYVAKPDRTSSAEVPDDRPAHNPPKACRECGSIRGATSRPLRRDRAVDYAANLSETLTRFGLEHNPVVLLLVVAHRKRFPEYASRDDDTFRIAVDYAVSEHVDAVLRPSHRDPARIRADGDVRPIVDRPGLPPASDDTRRRAYHGRPATHRPEDQD